MAVAIEVVVAVPVPASVALTLAVAEEMAHMPVALWLWPPRMAVAGALVVMMMVVMVAAPGVVAVTAGAIVLAVVAATRVALNYRSGVRASHLPAQRKNWTSANLIDLIPMCWDTVCQKA